MCPAWAESMVPHRIEREAPLGPFLLAWVPHWPGPERTPEFSDPLTTMSSTNTMAAKKNSQGKKCSVRLQF